MRDELKADFKIVDALTRGAKPATVASFQVASGVPQLNQTFGSTRPIYPS
jgi:hypothetical protein